MKLLWKKVDSAPLVVFFGALILRLWGLWFGLPGLSFPDEPHHINMAVSFGSGNLDPVFFKYPTFWMYLLFIAFVFVFAFWSGFGLLKSTTDYAHLFIWKPTLFFLTARFLTSLSGALVVFPLYLASKKLFQSRGAALLTVVLYALSPPLIYFCHQAKPDTLMMLFAACVWLFSIRYHQSGKIKEALGAWICLGLALTTQYTALLIAPLPFWAHLLRTESRTSVKKALLAPAMLMGILVVPLVFFAGSPYALIHWGDFWGDLSALRAYGTGELTSKKILLGWGVLKNYWDGFGANPLSAVFIFLSLLFTWLAYRKQAWLLTGPLIWGGLALAIQNQQAGLVNYCFSLYPGLFLLVGSLDPFASKFLRHQAFRPFLLAAIVLPPFFETARFDLSFSKEDTRLASRKWIESHIPIGTKILLDQPHTGPILIPTRNQVERLVSHTQSLNNPRERYYRTMLESHPGGGYEILRVDRTQKEMISPLQRHTQVSKQAWEWLDVESGLPALKSAGIRYVVWSTEGVTPENSPRLKQYFEDLFNKTRFVKEFPSNNPFSPTIKIYEVDSNPANAKR